MPEFRVPAWRRPPAAPRSLDGTKVSAEELQDRADGAADTDFLALGLGATNMMAMAWTVASGRCTVGVEMRGDPSLGVHWNLREDFYHHLGAIDQLMLERFGEERMPRRGDGSLFLLSEVFYTPDTVAGPVAADEVITGWDCKVHIGGRISHTEFVDDRWENGEPRRVIATPAPPLAPGKPEPDRVGRSVVDVLDGPSTFQAGAAEVLVLLRRWLEAIERQDLAAGVERPRVRLFVNHRVVDSSSPTDGYLKWFRRDDGFVVEHDGRMRVVIEALREFDYKGTFRRIRPPGTKPIDLGTPELFCVAQGFDSSDADRLGFRQEDVEVDHGDGRGPVVAQADYLAGLIEVLVDGRLRRRIASAFDREGVEYWVRQIAVGHEDDPEVGWILVQVPDFKTFDPINAGMVAASTDRDSAEYFAAYQHLLRDFFLEQTSLILEIPKEDLERVQLVYGPKLFSLVERMGADPQVAPNGVVAGDSFGNGHFLTSGGAVTGMVGHAHRVRQYWQARDAGESPEQSIRSLAAGIKEDTEGWLHVSAKEFSQAVPINFGEERIYAINRASGKDVDARAATMDATRRHRHSLLPLDPSDWRRLVVHQGFTHAIALPPLSQEHPLARGQADSADAAPNEGGPGAPVPVEAVAEVPSGLVEVPVTPSSGILNPSAPGER